MAFLHRLRDILFAPDRAWAAIAGEKTVGFLALYVAALAAVPALARFAGGSLVGVTAADGALTRLPLAAGTLRAAIEYALALAAVGVVALLAHASAPWFGGRRNLRQAVKLAAYSFTPAWLAGLFMLVPGLRFLAVFGLYGVYLAARGLPPLMGHPPEKSPACAAVLLVAAFAMMLLAVKVTAIALAAARLI